MFHIHLIMKVGNFIYYNIKELVAIRLISIRNWNYLHTLDDNFLFGFCKNRTLNHKFPTECGRWQNMCTEHGLTRSGLEPTIYRTRGEHANDYTTDESLVSISGLFLSEYIYCPGADPGFQVRGGGKLLKIAPSGGRREKFWGISCEKSLCYAKKSYFFKF